MVTPTIAAIGLAVMAALSFAGGFLVSDWRSDADIARLESQNQAYKAANEQCSNDVASVKARVAELIAVSKLREESAAAEMKIAQPEATTHTQRAIRIQAKPPVPREKQCLAIEQEQIEYVRSRR